MVGFECTLQSDSRVPRAGLEYKGRAAGQQGGTSDTRFEWHIEDDGRIPWAVGWGSVTVIA